MTQSYHTPSANAAVIPQPIPVKPLRPVPIAPRGKRSTILLVDDDPSVREALRRVLVKDGWNVVTAGSGEEALGRMQNAEPDLMITDLRMASVSGWDLLFHEKFQRPHLPVFVITALPAQATSDVEKFATEFFRKPLNLDALLLAVHRYLGVPETVPK